MARGLLALGPSGGVPPSRDLSRELSFLPDRYFSASTVFLSVPIDSIVQDERSPGLK
jgi:hypothetical protein